MARVYLARMSGSAGFSRLVAIKRLHPELAAEREFVAMLVDEARLAAQLRHTNIVGTLDLVASDGAFSLVLDYVEGVSLSALFRLAAEQKEKIPRPVAIAILYGVLRGLDAAHEARSDEGDPLGIVHRDVSPQNVLVGVDGISRVIDFGVAKALGRFESTKPGEVRGKFAYMAPEQLMGRPVTRQVDVYAAGVVLWELLTGSRLFSGEDQRVVCAAVLRGEIPPPSTRDATIPRELDAIIERATARDLSNRFMTAREMLTALDGCEAASDDEVGAWVRRLAAKTLHERQRMIQAVPATAAGRSIEDLMVDLARSRSTQETPLDGVTPGLTGSARSEPFAPLLTSSSSHPSAMTGPPVNPFAVRQSPSGSGVEIVARPPERPSSRRLVAYTAAVALSAFVIVAIAIVGARRAPRAAAIGAAPTATIVAAPATSDPPDDGEVPRSSAPPSPTSTTEAPPLEVAPPRVSPPAATRTVKRPHRPRAPSTSPSSPVADPKSYR